MRNPLEPYSSPGHSTASLKRQRSKLPVAQAATGQTLPGLTNAEIHRILDEEELVGSRQGTLADFFASSPLRESGLKIARPQDSPRDIDL